MNSAATTRSAFLACSIIDGSAEKVGSSGSSSTSTAFGAGEGVPITRRGPEGSSGDSLIRADPLQHGPTGSRRLAVSHRAMSTRKPRPPSQASRPSVTVPVRPREKPPGLASFRVSMM